MESSDLFSQAHKISPLKITRPLNSINTGGQQIHSHTPRTHTGCIVHSPLHCTPVRVCVPVCVGLWGCQS